jgi:hypothetical protein
MTETNYEISELQAVDFALGAHLAKAFQGLSRDVGPKQYREFLSRDHNKQIYRHEYESPRELLEAVGSAKKTAATKDGVKSNLPDLPLVVYYRSPGMVSDSAASVFPEMKMWNEAETNAYNLTIVPLTLAYNLTFLAWDKPTLDKLQLAWLFFISKIRKGNERFTMPYRIGEDVFEVPARISGSRSWNFANIATDKTAGRLFAVNTPLEVVTQVIMGEGAVWADPVVIDFELKEILP